MPTEKTITAAIIKYLKSLPECWHIKVFGGPRGRAGAPDLLVCRKGLFYAIEVKKPGGKGPTKLQERELAAIMKAGALAFTARSVDDVRNVMEAERRTIQIKGETER
jgi:hypothetical protein